MHNHTIPVLYTERKCWKISNYQLLTWKTEYSINPDNSNPRLLELFTLPFRVSPPGRRPRGLLRVPTPQTSAETREQKRRLIKAHFQIGEVHFRP